MTQISLETFFDHDYFVRLQAEDQSTIRRLHERFEFSVQQFRQLCEGARDLQMWLEQPMHLLLQQELGKLSEKMNGRQMRNQLMSAVSASIQVTRSRIKQYSEVPLVAPKRNPQRISIAESDRKVLGDCPVYSEKLVCCQLKTIDAVQNCAFGCSYCTIQTFYGDEVSIDGRLKEKLKSAVFEPEKFHHVGTGQSSDALVWGNKGGILDDLMDFARDNANVLLEFKTKSSNIKYFEEHQVPQNIVCSWSLNTETIVNNEEHFTARLDKRIASARKIADLGIPLAFHFHPIVWYEGWKEEYSELAQRVLATFKPEEVLFVSFGSVTFIKPVIQKLRASGHQSKMLQMEMVPDPHGKLSYPDDVKVEIFQTMVDLFKPWDKKVFQYLCMERAYFWDRVWGSHYETNDDFALAFGRSVWPKVYRGHHDETLKDLFTFLQEA